MPSSKQAYPSFSNLKDREVAQHFKLIWDQLNALKSAAPVDLSGLTPITRKIATLGGLLGGGTLDKDLTLRLAASPEGIVPSFIAENSVLETIQTATTTVLAFDSDVRNPTGMHNAGVLNSRATITLPGAYLFGAHVSWSTASGAGRRQTSIIKNGVAAAKIGLLEGPVVAVAMNTFIVAFDDCVAGDFYEVNVFQSSGAPLDVLATTNPRSPRFWGVRLGK